MVHLGEGSSIQYGQQMDECEHNWTPWRSVPHGDDLLDSETRSCLRCGMAEGRVLLHPPLKKIMLSQDMIDRVVKELDECQKPKLSR